VYLVCHESRVVRSIKEKSNVIYCSGMGLIAAWFIAVMDVLCIEWSLLFRTELSVRCLRRQQVSHLKCSALTSAT